MELTRFAELFGKATGSLTRLYSSGKRGNRSRGRTNRLRRFGPHTTLIRQRLTDLESLRQAAAERQPL